MKALKEIEVLHFGLRQSIGKYYFHYIPHKEDLISLEGNFYKVLERAHNLDSESRRENAFAIVVKPVAKKPENQDSFISKLIKSVSEVFQ